MAVAQPKTGDGHFASMDLLKRIVIGILTNPASCQRLRTIDYYYRNRDRCLKAGKSYREVNAEKERVRCRSYSARHPEKAVARAKKWDALNPEKRKQIDIRFRQNNPEACRAKQQRYSKTPKAKARARRYYNADPERRRAQWRASNRKHAAERTRKRWQRYLTDPAFNVNIRTRRNIWRKLDKCRKGLRKTGKTINILGCSFDEYRVYLESKFTGGMNWAAFLSGQIWIDHIRPVATFDLTDPEQVKKCFHFTNTQPLWKQDNMKKSDKISPEYGNATV